MAPNGGDGPAPEPIPPEEIPNIGDVMTVIGTGPAPDDDSGTVSIVILHATNGHYWYASYAGKTLPGHDEGDIG
jgi:hypothetical protein